MIRGSAGALVRVLTCRLGLMVGLGSVAGLVVGGAPRAAYAAESAASPEAETTPASDAPSEATMQEARLHFGNGVELLQATPPNYQDAYRQFQLAYDKSGKNWKVLGNLGLCALKLERDGEALAHYEHYLEQGGAEIDADERASIEREVLLLRGNMATLRVSSPEPGARVSVSRKGSEAPAQLYDLGAEGAEIGVRSGELTVTATAGDKSESWQVVLSASETKSHEFSFTPKTDAAPAAATSALPAEKSGPSTLQIIGYSTAGVGVAALVGGVITGVLAKSKESDAADSCIENVCSEDTEAEFDGAADLAMISNILFVSGGVLAATGITLVIVGAGQDSGETALAPPSRHARSAARPRLALTPTLGGVVASGHF